jgi:hypothetical protein
VKIVVVPNVVNMADRMTPPLLNSVSASQREG